MKNINIIISILLSAIFMFGCKKTDSSQIEENFYLKNDGAEMPVFVRGSASAKKILVIVHGGPGGTSLQHYYQVPGFTSKMEENYLLVYWEQRGSGMSSGKLDEDDFTLEKMSKDLDKLLYVLAHKYGKDKELFLLGQSFGSLLTAKFVSSANADNHNIAGWITIGNIYSFTEYPRVVRAHAKQFLDKQTSSSWDGLKSKMAGLNYNESTIETISEWNEFGGEMQAKVRELGFANLRQVTEMKGVVSFSFYSLFTVLSNDLNASSAIFNDIFNKSLKEELRHATIPALWLSGEHDYVTPRSYADDLMTFYGHSDKKHVVFPRGSHNVIATNLEETIQEMSLFIDAH